MLSKAIGRKGGDLFQTARLLKEELLQLTLLGVTEAEGAGPQITSDVDARRSSAAACWHGRIVFTIFMGLDLTVVVTCFPGCVKRPASSQFPDPDDQNQDQPPKPTAAKAGRRP